MIIVVEIGKLFDLWGVLVVDVIIIVDLVRFVDILLLAHVLAEVEGGVIVGILFMLDLLLQHLPVLHQKLFPLNLFLAHLLLVLRFHIIVSAWVAL